MTWPILAASMAFSAYIYYAWRMTSPSATTTAAQLHQAMFDLLRWMRAAPPAGALGLSKLGMLAYLRRQGAATATALAAYLNRQPQSLTRQLADLEARGLIIRQPDVNDRRQSVIHITPAGETQLLAEVAEQRARLAQSIARQCTPTEQQLIGLAAELIGQLAKTAEPAAPSPTSTANAKP